MFSQPCQLHLPLLVVDNSLAAEFPLQDLVLFPEILNHVLLIPAHLFLEPKSFSNISIGLTFITTPAFSFRD